MRNDANPFSEACLVIAEIAPQLPDRTRAELTRLLEHSVAMPSDQELREMRLGLLVELVRTESSQTSGPTKKPDRSVRLKAKNGLMPAT